MKHICNAPAHLENTAEPLPCLLDDAPSVTLSAAEQNLVITGQIEGLNMRQV